MAKFKSIGGDWVLADSVVGLSDDQLSSLSYKRSIATQPKKVEAVKVVKEVKKVEPIKRVFKRSTRKK